MKNKKIILFLAVSFLSAFLFLSFSVYCQASSGGFNYTPMEKIPGSPSSGTFGAYVLSIYKFAIWSVGIAALFMIMLGGFMYITSAGNNAAMGKAKEFIFDAIIGLVMALAAWVILNEINPQLVQIKTLSQQLDEAARNYPRTDGSQYPPVATSMPRNCNDQQWQDAFNQAAGGDPVQRCTLQALTAIESGCNQGAPRTQGGRDCGPTQIAAQANCGTTCEALEASPQLALQCSARYLQTCSGRWRGAPGSEQQIRDMYAGYNGGCGALQPSASCAGQVNQYGNPFQRWDCPVNPGGYQPVPGRTSAFLNYYNQCRGAS